MTGFFVAQLAMGTLNFQSKSGQTITDPLRTAQNSPSGWLQLAG
jgi:hypothetical protein